MKTMKKYSLEPSEKTGFSVCTDHENQVVCVFENNNFNDSQKFTPLNDNTSDPSELATIARGIGEYLFQNHYAILF
jgi:hypothetical protein